MLTLLRIATKLINMSGIADNLSKIKDKLPSDCKLVVVSKTRTVDEIMEVYKLGHRRFGENKVQALLERANTLPQDIEWHLIGHLQTNKVKYIAPFISMIQSVDSLKLLREIEKQAAKNKRIISCLLQIHIAREDTKFGFSTDELIAFLNSDEWKVFKHIQFSGIMAMATYTTDLNIVEGEFQLAHSIFSDIKNLYFKYDSNFCELSIGMSGDYDIAVKYGSTMVRIGSAVFE